ncbi:uncharacterized protein M421DRAFT_92243 [Didymella exigua CBS 183.55]|uniref:Uncharacterized protein n=1 Tax=Didymella exigua CBS 183.55 TaxID=1150837 RepID=A0A6A5RMZ2_9PLEO|nr:uncharacterized protein M421DRAFT_92243 [Didymella exigua CBS 183.55]KAF1928498.1 hypothetical protein M421DRAFT_92243 [Didymella exigua CBS 183.55]
MAGHIILVSCLLAICLPIICVQLPRFATVKEVHAETEAETRSTLLRQRTLSPSGAREVLRRFARSWSEASLEIASADPEQEQSGFGNAAAPSGGRRWYTGTSRATFQGDACADGRRSSKEEVELRKARAGKKPWDPPFKRQLAGTELAGKSPVGRWHAVTDASPPRKTGRDLEARGLARRLFPPDPVTEMDGSEYDRLQSPHEILNGRPPPKNQSQSHGMKAGPSSEPQSRPSQTASMPPLPTDSESLPSPLDGSPLLSETYLPQSTPPIQTRGHRRCRCHHSGHSGSESTVPEPPNVASTAAKESYPFGGGLLCQTCPRSCPRLSVEPCEHPSTDSPKSRQDDVKAIPHEHRKVTGHDPSENSAKQSPMDTGKSSPKDVVKQAPIGAPRPSGKDRKISMPLWQILLVAMGFVTFVFAVAILVAHCLAWFLVYKTEARLGEVRAGLLRGGEMKLCLCGRG